MYKFCWRLLDDVSAWVLAGCLPSNCSFLEEIILVNSPDKRWGTVGCAGTDGRRGPDEVGATGESCEKDGQIMEAVATSTVCGLVGPKLIVYELIYSG